MNSAPEYLDIGQAAAALATSERHARRLLADAPEDAAISVPSAGGRPERRWHYTAHPALNAWYFADGPGAVGAASTSGLAGAGQAGTDALAAHDAAIAKFRSLAVAEYLERRARMPEADAARLTCEEWARRPRETVVRITDRLPGNHQRSREQQVRVGGFRAATLRRWASLYIRTGGAGSGGAIAALAPRRAGRVGRGRADIPDGLLDIVQAVAAKNPRADLPKALEFARGAWAGEFPDVSYSTWLRRLRERDPAGICETLGKRGLAAFRQEHSPDINRDYSELAFNALWTLDDVQMDFYGHDPLDPARLLRPFCYAIIRVSTRQWICGLAAATPITQDQVRSLVGMALASASGGIPDEMIFEHGTVACDNLLAENLDALGVRVKRTMMDSGRVHPDAFPDVQRGHPQGKAVIEANMRRLHNIAWDQPGQTGGEERNTAASNLEAVKRAAMAQGKAIKDGAGNIHLILPSASDWPGIIAAAIEAHNNKPHSGLPMILNPETNEKRHMSPNEAAAAKRGEIRVMDEKLLPLFFARGTSVPVTKNGFRLGELWYGKFDEDLSAFAGRRVTAFAMPEAPGVAYVQELGRCVEYWRPVKYGVESDALEKKFAAERGKISQYRELIQRVAQTPGTVTIDTTRFTADPTPDRARKTIAPAALADRARRMADARDTRRTAREKSDARFNVLSDRPSVAGHAGAGPAVGRHSMAAPRRRGLISSAEEIAEHVRVLSDLQPANIGGMSEPEM